MTDQNRGVLLTLGAFVLWGLVPIYFKLLTGVEAFEILAHRIIWSVLALVAVMLLLKRSILVMEILKKPELRRTLFISAILISVNWLIFAWAVTHDQILATSLGYFINPLVSVMLGMIVLGERLSRNQYLALMLVVFAIANQIWSFGELPWVALSLALSFGFYGLLRKRADVDAYNGLLVEVLLMLPFAMGYLLWKMQVGTLVFTQQSTMMDIPFRSCNHHSVGAVRRRCQTDPFVYCWLHSVYRPFNHLPPGSALLWRATWYGAADFLCSDLGSTDSHQH